MIIPPGDRARLVKLLGMLGSDFDGERSSAGRMASDLIKKLGATWDNVIVNDEKPQPRTKKTERPEYQTYQDPWRAVKWWKRVSTIGGLYPNLLTEWERYFVRSIEFRESLSLKQTDVARRIADKLRQAGVYNDE